MKTCSKCGTGIENLHQNSKTCISCRKKLLKRVIVHRVETIEIPVKDFRELERLANIGKHFLGINKILKERKCMGCDGCKDENGITISGCVLYDPEFELEV